MATVDRGSETLSILTLTTLFPNPVQRSNGIFVENRLRHLMTSGAVTARVVAPVPYLPSFVINRQYGKLHLVPDREQRDGLTIDHPRYLAIPKIGMRVTPYTLYRAMAARVRRLMREGCRFDLIDAHYFYPDGVAAVWLARALGLPVTVTARGTDLNLIPRYAGPRRLIQEAAAAADGLITVCAALKTSLVELGVAPERVTVLRNGVDLTRFTPDGRAAARRSWGFTRRTLGSVGHLIERKGHHLVIAALAHLPDTDLVIAGAGPERGALEALAARRGLADRVRFAGSLDTTTLRTLYAGIDALVLASSREGWANVLLEAMACGTPVVASAVWGTPEVVAAPEAGTLMSSLDVDGVVTGVERLFRHLPDRAATRAYAERFDWQATTDGQLSLFRQIVRRRAAV